MKKILVLLSVLALIPTGAPVSASVSASSTSLLTTNTSVNPTSTPLPLFAITLGQTSGETLSSVQVTINNAGTSTASGSDIASISVYKDTGNGTFETGTDQLAGTQTNVNIVSPTTITTSAHNAIDGGKFFVTLQTSSSWSSTNPADSINVTLGASGVTTSTNSPTLTSLTTANITADSTGPTLQSAVAINSGGSTTKNAGDKVELTFDETTNKASITAANIASVLQLNNGHSFLDGLASIGGSAWSSDGRTLTITLSNGSSVPTIEIGDTLTIASNTITDTLGNVATGTKTITGTFGADTAGPTLSSVVAKNTGGTSAKEAGDKVELTFSEATNRFAITAGNITSILQINNGHSFLDGAASIGGSTWSNDGKVLTITLSAATSLPTVVVGDIVTIAGNSIEDTSGNDATGSSTISGNFGGGSNTGDDDDNDEDTRKKCKGEIKNGRLYKIKGSNTVYLSVSCKLRPFRGQAVFKSRGYKFKNIITLDKLPDNVSISNRPALPARGTLIRGDKDKTVWFVTEDGKRRGFTRKEVFERLGFLMQNVEVISQSDLETMLIGDNIDAEDTHPDGTIAKCENSTVVFEVKGKRRQEFTSQDVFNARGHQFKHIISIDCSKFTYSSGSTIQ